MVTDEVVLYTAPRLVTVDPPSDVTFPFTVAVVVLVAVAATVVTLGTAPTFRIKLPLEMER